MWQIDCSVGRVNVADRLPLLALMDSKTAVTCLYGRQISQPQCCRQRSTPAPTAGDVLVHVNTSTGNDCRHRRWKGFFLSGQNREGGGGGEGHGGKGVRESELVNE